MMAVCHPESVCVQEADILQLLSTQPYKTQRIIAEKTGFSIGSVNRSLKSLKNKEFLDQSLLLTEKSNNLIARNSPKNAIILAAGFGMRMIPVNLYSPKALVDVKGEVLIERVIKQLHAAGIFDVSVVVGYMKESFEYLIDAYGVELIVNNHYAEKNNLYSLSLAAEKLNNTYIIPCDIWCQESPFRTHELYSWYMLSDVLDKKSVFRVNKKREIVKIKQNTTGNKVIGIAYLNKDDARQVKTNIKALLKSETSDDLYWESALLSGNKMIISSRVEDDSKYAEINTYEQLRELDASSNQLKLEAVNIIQNVFHCDNNQIQDISVLKKGMTNRSFLFSVKGKKYIMRIPGAGTDQLIKRKQEADVYRAIAGKNLCDDPIYLNPDNGYKITRFLKNVRACDPENTKDLIRCMDKLREFHSLKLEVSHTFNVFEQIEFYESLRNGQPSVFADYEQTKKNAFSLQEFIANQKKDYCLTHIDAVPDNFLFHKNDKNREEQIQLIDWEYSSMQDPHLDIAMFCVYSFYNQQKCDELIDIYFKNSCDTATRIKIYCYIAVCGLLWSNWCEYKRLLGVEFGEYSLRQYRYAKDFYKLSAKLMKQEGFYE